MTLFYVPDIQSAVLPEEESQHAVKVLRLQSGDDIVVVDGKGGYHEARITFAHHKKCGFEIISSVQEFNKRDYYLHLAIAPTKNMERLEWFLEKVTEIGVDEVTPILCQNSERKVIKPERLEKIIVSASKQSVKAYFSQLNPLTDVRELIQNAREENKFMAHCREGQKQMLHTESFVSGKILLLIGPEGDFSKEEIALAEKNGFKAITLGESRLRTETAGVYACSLIQILKSLKYS